MTAERDQALMARAVALARQAIASAKPNPAVGCVIVNEGRIVGEGFTQRAGGHHAEIEALNAAGAQAAGATVYVSLEPCAHTGRTGPCVGALIKACVKRVVFAVEDPNPAVAGLGQRQLAEAGIRTESPLLQTAAEEVNRGYLARHRRGRPWIRLKMAASLDGRTALANGESQWITGSASRQDVHRWRARSSAIMTGIGTVLADDPSLTARWSDADIDVVQPMRIVVDTNLKTPANAKTLGLDGEVIVFAGRNADAGRRQALIDAGARVEFVAAEPGVDRGGVSGVERNRASGVEPGVDPGRDPGRDPGLDLGAIARRLAELEINDVWLESGPVLAGAMLAAGLIDELILYLAPCLLGADARGLFALPPIETLDARVQLQIDDLRKFGNDLRIIARPVTAGKRV
jgi:diaminohydroxyphosphoribosylaminopyrimidine deaminase/5-amino-6-(5-phosphoribosylamino)uracil reductase